MTRHLRTVLDGAIEAAAVVLMLAMLAVVVIGVAFRLANEPVVWSDELAQYLLVWLGFVGWIIASRRRSHIRINVFIDQLPRRPRIGLEVAIQALVIVFAAVLLWHSRVLIARNLDVPSVTLPFPSAMLYVLLPVLGIVLIAQAVAEIAEVLSRPDRARLDQGGKAL